MVLIVDALELFGVVIQVIVLIIASQERSFSNNINKNILVSPGHLF